MIKSLKGQFILSILVALAFIYNSFYYTEFTDRGRILLSQIITLHCHDLFSLQCWYSNPKIYSI